MAMENAAASLVDMRLERGATPELEIICSVCMDLISDHEGPLIVTECGHGFHERCLQSWFDKGAEDGAIKTSGDCPVCNERVFMGACRKFYPSTQEKMGKRTVPSEALDKAMAENEDLKKQLEDYKSREPKQQQLSKTAKSTRGPIPTAAASTKASILRIRTAAASAHPGAASAQLGKPKAAPPTTVKKVMLKLPKVVADPPKKSAPGASKMDAKTGPTRVTRSAASQSKATSGSTTSAKLATVNGDSKPSSAKAVRKDVVKPAKTTTSGEEPPKKRITRSLAAAALAKTNDN